MRPRSLLVFSSFLVLLSACAKASISGGAGGDSSGPGGGTTGNPTTGSATTSGNPGTTSSSTGGVGGDPTAGSTTSAASTSNAASSTSSGPVCADSPCKLTVPQCGCAAGEQCTVDSTGVVCGTPGNTGPGQVCTGPDCAAGLLCVNTSPTVSTCSRFCDSDSDCSAPGGLCIIGLNGGNMMPIPGVTLCTENCDPTTNTGCPAAGTACEVAQENAGQMRFLTHCTGSGAGQQGATCVTGADCAPTFGCFNTTNPTAVKCLKNCKASAPNACPAGTQCLFFMTPELVGNEEYGACL